MINKLEKFLSFKISLRLFIVFLILFILFLIFFSGVVRHTTIGGKKFGKFGAGCAAAFGKRAG